MQTAFLAFLSLELALLLAAVEAPGDADLAERIRAGDQAAFRRFFDRYHRMLFHFLVRRGVRDAVAEDLVQQAFVRIWEHRSEIDPARSLRAYLFRMAYTRALNHFRDTAKFDEAADTSLHASAKEADQEAAYRLAREALQRAVDELPERRRAVFELCFMEELTYREAAEVLGVSVKTIENQMGHALKAVRQAMAIYL